MSASATSFSTEATSPRGPRRSSTPRHGRSTSRRSSGPALERGASVVCDRYIDSSVAYQGVARGLGLERVLDLNVTAVGGLMPDRTFLLQIDPADVPNRLGGNHDRLEREGDAFRALAASAYRDLAARFPERIVVLDGTRDAEDLAEYVYRELHGGP